MTPQISSIRQQSLLSPSFYGSGRVAWLGDIHSRSLMKCRSEDRSTYFQDGWLSGLQARDLRSPQAVSWRPQFRPQEHLYRTSILMNMAAGFPGLIDPRKRARRKPSFPFSSIIRNQALSPAHTHREGNWALLLEERSIK